MVGIERASPGFWVTCYTDASFSREGAGWGVWLRSNLGRLVRRGPCPAYVHSANEAEMAAIFAGLYLAHRTWGAAVRGIWIFTDSQAAIHVLTADPHGKRSTLGVARLRDKIRTFAEEHGIELDLRWVKGHQKTNTQRAYLNGQCDRMAGAARSLAEASPKPKTATPRSSSGEAQPAERRSRKQKQRARRARARAKKKAKKGSAQVRRTALGTNLAQR